MGGSSHFLCLDAPVTNKHIVLNPITVLQPDGDTMVLTTMGDLDLSQLPQAAQRYHILPAIKHSLKYVVKLCKAGFKVKLVKWGVGIEIRYRGRLVLRCLLNKHIGLWIVPLTHSNPLTTQPQPQMHIKQAESNIVTQTHMEHPTLDPITSLCSSSNL